MSFPAHSNLYLSLHLTLCLFSHKDHVALESAISGKPQRRLLNQSSLKRLHFLDRTSMGECIEHAHYFNSLTPDQNNQDFCHQNYNMPGSVCSDVCGGTRIQCLAGCFTANEWPMQLFVYCVCLHFCLLARVTLIIFLLLVSKFEKKNKTNISVPTETLTN